MASAGPYANLYLTPDRLDNHAGAPPLSFFTGLDALSAAQPTASNHGARGTPRKPVNKELHAWYGYCYWFIYMIY